MIDNIDLAKAPHKSGVYFFKDENDEVIYVGSSKNLYNRMKEHKCCINKGSNHGGKKDFYQFLQSNQIKVELQLTDNYRQLEQELIEKYSPKYNTYKAFTGVAYNGNAAEYSRKYRETLHEETLKQAKRYRETHKEQIKQKDKQRKSQLCNYNGEILKLAALAWRLKKQGIPNPTAEAKKYLIKTS